MFRVVLTNLPGSLIGLSLVIGANWSGWDQGRRLIALIGWSIVSAVDLPLERQD